MISKKISALLKSWVPGSVKEIIRRLPLFNYSDPYLHVTPKDEQFNVSDYFLFRCDEYETVFIAENNLAITLAEPIKCTHVFTFYDSGGVMFRRYEVVDSDYHYSLNIDHEIAGVHSMGGFIHQTYYEKENIEKLNCISEKKLNFQHRGYTGFRNKKLNNVMYSFVHGNFGALYINKNGEMESLARHTKEHSYTPQCIINPNNSYEFYFLNPVNKDMKITVIIKDVHDNKIVSEDTIKAFSPYRFEINRGAVDAVSNITWTSKLPICRAIVFEKSEDGFDVFHS